MLVVLATVSVAISKPGSVETLVIWDDRTTVNIRHVLLVTLLSSNNRTKIEIGLILMSMKCIRNMADPV